MFYIKDLDLDQMSVGAAAVGAFCNVAAVVIQAARRCVKNEALQDDQN